MTIMNVMMSQERVDEGRDCRISQKSRITEGIFNIIVLFFSSFKWTDGVCWRRGSAM